MKFVTRIFFLEGILILCSLVSGLAQTDQEKPDSPKDAHVKIVNACEVTLPQPWKAGMDLAFKDAALSSDVRPGEKCPYRKISFTGKDNVSIRMTQTKAEVASIPADFEKGCFYTIILTGQVSESGGKIVPIIRKDFPQDPAVVHSGEAMVNVFNSISSFPLSISSGKAFAALAPATATTIYLPGGMQSVDVKYRDFKNKEQILRNKLVVQPGNTYSVIILNSSEGGNRPMIFKADDSDEQRDTVEQEASAEKDKKAKTSAPGA